jgi:2-polyprenyl-3-methyl-5-hydroxy-6-metoxy-1,4-benzoquinol methylase
MRQIIKRILMKFGLLETAKNLRIRLRGIFYSIGYRIFSFDYKFANAQKEWTHVPIDKIGYHSSQELLSKRNEELIEITRTIETNRYNLDDWKNYQNLWRKYSGVDDFSGKLVLDFGCGFGIESLQFCKSGNRVYLADIVGSNLDLAEKVLIANGYEAEGKLLVQDRYPFFDLNEKVDIFYSNGVLHHTPHIKEILKRATEILKENGLIILMLYSDVSWKMATNSEVPAIDEDVRRNKHFKLFVRTMDSVGEYADWYNKQKIEYLLGDFLEIVDFSYICSNNRYLFVRLKIK